MSIRRNNDSFVPISTRTRTALFVVDLFFQQRILSIYKDISIVFFLHISIAFFTKLQKWREVFETIILPPATFYLYYQQDESS